MKRTPEHQSHRTLTGQRMDNQKHYYNAVKDKTAKDRIKPVFLEGHYGIKEAVHK